MFKASVKYSIVIPVYNGVEYLPECINSIINQNYFDYEIIISNDHSTDTTAEYLSKLNHPNIFIIMPPKGLSMTEHWEFAISHAIGEWQMFLGQDDALQSYFFKLANHLTDLADEKNIKLISSERAYFFWPGIIYKNLSVSYIAYNKISVKCCKFETIKTLLGLKSYFDLPHMYTTSIFNKKVINEVKKIQNGNLLVTHPQDANLAAIGCSLEKYYINSKIPLSWVGTSPKSAGMAITENSDEDFNDNNTKIIKQDYLNKISKSKLKYDSSAGKFSYGNNTLYFYQSLLQTIKLRKNSTYLKSKFYKYILYSVVFYELNSSKKKYFTKNDFKNLLTNNHCNFKIVKTLSLFLIMLNYLNIAKKLFFKIFIYIFYTKITVKLKNTSNNLIEIQKLNFEIEKKIYKKSWF